jgi:carboxyl-terminal processing protease
MNGNNLIEKILQFMKRNYKIIVPLIFVAASFLSFRYFTRPNPGKEQETLLTLYMLLKRGHYQPISLNDSISRRFYKDYLEVIDPAKHYFLQSDIEEFNSYKNQLDDEVQSGDLHFFNLVYERLQKRITESKEFYRELLTKAMEIQTPDSLSTDYENKDFPKDKPEREQRWLKELKMRFLNHLYEKEEEQKSKLEEDSSYVKKTFEELKKEAFEDTQKEMDNLYERILEQNREDWLSYYLNTLASEYGPHTMYMPPKIKKRFDISMSGKLEGIGARLQKEGAYTKVVSLISGGPAWKAGELEVGDLILKVAQGDNVPVDIVGMRLDDAIELIKGKKGTEVRLTLKKVDGSVETISIIRDIVELEETFVKSSIIEVEENRYGLINLPQFYIDFNERNYRNSATDMAKEISRLKEEGVKGLVIDLRNNGGGSLKTAVEIAGMFIDQGPVVQVKYRDEKPVIREDNQEGLLWEGPLVILVNEFSASASEIFAAAMQDYNRAIIIGGKQTFGKGTVQNIIPLDKYSFRESDLGFLKLTIQKFYRINGGSTQLKGVTPDIQLPTRYAYMDVGERDEKYPMPWDKIKKIKYNTFDKLKKNLKRKIIELSLSRTDTNRYFKLVDEQARWMKTMSEDHTVYLSYERYKEDLEKKDMAGKKFEELNQYDNHLNILSPQYETNLVRQDTILKDKREKWHKDLRKDAYLEEAVRVLKDLQ